MSADVDAAREALLAEAAENGVWLEFTAALDAFEAAIRADEREKVLAELVAQPMSNADVLPSGRLRGWMGENRDD